MIVTGSSLGEPPHIDQPGNYGAACGKTEARAAESAWGIRSMPIWGTRPAMRRLTRRRSTTNLKRGGMRTSGRRAGVLSLLATLAVAGEVGIADVSAGAAGPPTTTSASAPSAAPAGPLQIASTTLSQSGRELVWAVRLTEPFSPRALAVNHRALCLLFERLSNGSVRGQACISVAGRSRRPVLVFSPVTAAGPAPGTRITASITRPSSRELTAIFLPRMVGTGYRPLRWQVLSTLRPPACVPPGPGHSACSVRFPVRPALLSLHVPQLVGCTASGPAKVFNGPSGRREIALTFDDGPSLRPPAIDFVRLLARERAPATFFELGRQIRAVDPSGAVERAMLAGGDMLGDHTWTHPKMTALSAAAQTSQLTRTAAAIRQRTGFTPCLWRPPYGSIDRRLVALARSLGMLTVMWDVDPRDWSLPGTSVIVRRVVSAARNGAIVIEHFGGGPRYQTLAALPREIATLRREGYTFVTVTQLLGLALIYR